MSRRIGPWGARFNAEGKRVRVLALHAPWSQTQGTAHTVTRAREAGLTVVGFTFGGQS